MVQMFSGYFSRKCKINSLRLYKFRLLALNIKNYQIVITIALLYFIEITKVLSPLDNGFVIEIADMT